LPPATKQTLLDPPAWKALGVARHRSSIMACLTGMEAKIEPPDDWVDPVNEF